MENHEKQQRVFTLELLVGETKLNSLIIKAFSGLQSCKFSSLFKFRYYPVAFSFSSVEFEFVFVFDRLCRLPAGW